MDSTTVQNTPSILSDELKQGLVQRPDTIDSAKHAEIIQRVIECYRACKADQPGATTVYQPGGEWADYLAERQGSYTALIEGDADTAAVKFKNFWRNDLSPIVKEYAKYEQITAGEQTFIDRFETNVRRNYDIWKEIFRAEDSVLEVPNVGNPWGLMINDQMVIPKATRFHALSTQIQELVRDVDSPVIGEIGAGYGGQAYYLLRDHAKATYVDFDLPETMVIAAYYLLATCPDRSAVLYGESTAALDEQIEANDIVIMPNFALPQLGDRTIDLFLNSFSFSEMPVETLTEYLQQVGRTTRKYLLHNNMDRRRVINRGHERNPASEYPIDASTWKRIYKKFDLFHGHQGDYREFLYERIC